jgi:hypothetical protein
MLWLLGKGSCKWFIVTKTIYIFVRQKWPNEFASIYLKCNTKKISEDIKVTVRPEITIPSVENVTSTKSNHESKIISSVDPHRIKNI